MNGEQEMGSASWPYSMGMDLTMIVRWIAGGVVVCILACASAEAADLSVGSVSMVQGGAADVVVSGDVAGESTYGVTVVLEITPRAGATGTVQFTPAPTVDIVQTGDPWPAAGTFSAFDTDSEAFSATLNGSVDDSGAYEAAAVTFSGPLTSFRISASPDATGVWDVLLATQSGSSSWEGIATTLSGGTITVCEAADAPTEPVGKAGYDKVFYLSLVPGNPGAMTALRVTLTNLPPPFADHNGETRWVGAPATVCQNQTQTSPPCSNPSDSFEASRLSCTPYYMDWSTISTLYIYDQAIVPGAVYDVQAIHQSCDTAEEGNYSDSLTINTSLWGDVCGWFDSGTSTWAPPDGSVDLTTDYTAVADKFSGVATAPHKARCDLDPNVPDRRIDVADILAVIAGFQGVAYVFDGPSVCP